MLLDKKMFKFIDKKIDDYTQALQIGVNTLVENGYCEFELYNKIIESVNKYGMYFILIPHIALAHAEQGEWCQKVGVSLTIFKYPIKFSEDKNHQVKVIFTLSTIDSHSHMEILREFVEKISNESFQKKLLSINSYSEAIKELFDNGTY